MGMKPSRGESPEVMKSEGKGTNDSAEPSIKQDDGQAPVIHASRDEEKTYPWIQLLHALDQPDLFGWPLVAPIKVPMQKCKKCSLEFCSSINYRRHIRVHRQSSTLNKESKQNKDLLAAFWDKLPLEKAEELVAFNEAMLKEIPGASIVTTLASSLCNPAVWALPHVYVRAGSLLLDMIQAISSRQPISSQQLFCILDDASEKTLLCGGTPESVQNYLFDGEATKTCLELKNLVASTSFLFEQQLVKAWVTDKDAEALRCQKLLVEEEEASKKRLAELSKRKKLKKLRRKEHKLKELSHQCEGDLNVAVNSAESPVLAQVFVPSSPSNSSPNSTYGLENRDSGLESLQNQEEDLEAQIDLSNGSIIQGDSETVESQIACESNSKCEPESVDVGLESPHSPKKDLKRPIDLSSEDEKIENLVAGSKSSQNSGNNLEAQIDISISQGDTQMAGKTNSTCGPKNVHTGHESPLKQEESEAQNDLISGVINQDDAETINSKMVGESGSIHGPENINIGFESPKNQEKDLKAVNDVDAGSAGITTGETAIDLHEESGSIHGPEKINVGVESPKGQEKDLKAVNDVDVGSAGITTGETAMDLHEACEPIQDTSGYLITPSVVDENFHHDHKDGNNSEVQPGAISVEANTPWCVVIGDIVVYKEVGCPIIFCKGSPIPTPFDDCGNRDHSLQVAAGKDLLRQRYSAAVEGDHGVLAQ